MPIVVTPIPNRADMPAQLPDNTPTLYGFELEPSGTTFSVPVTVKLLNWRNAPTSIAIPTGSYDTVNGRWEHEAQATWDGSRFVFQTSHFSTFDCNYPLAGGPLGGGGGGGGGGPECIPTGSSCAIGSGSVEQGFALPTYKVKSEDFGITLDYRSGPAGSWKLGKPQGDYAAVDHSTFAVPLRGMKYEAICVPSPSATSGLGAAEKTQPGVCNPEGSACALGRATPIGLTLTRSLAGTTATDSVTMGLSNAEAEYDAYVTLPRLSATESAGTGLYRMRTSVSAGTPGSCISGSATFGAGDPAAPRAQTSLEAGPISTFDTHVLVHHRLTSPFGSGWGIREVSRLYRNADVAHLVHGTGDVEVFRPRAHAKTLNGSPGSMFVLTRDLQTGEVFAARDDGRIDLVDATTGAFTPVLSGLAFNSPVHALAVGYEGTSRRFIVALANRLLEIDSAGAQRQLASRLPGAQYSQAAVAARADAVFYADSNSPTLWRISLSDASRTLVAATVASGGDTRIWPKAALSGVQLAEPRSLVFAPDGTLYLADRRRHVVYAVLPDAGGAIGATSRVQPVVGDGTANALPPPGERYPGTALGVREPLGVTLSEDGYLIVATTYGFVSYDPVATEAEWLFTFGFTGELAANPLATRFGALAITGTTLLSRNDSPVALARYDVDRMSSEYRPTRTLRVLAGGELELLDTGAETIEKFDSAGRLVERRKRTGELVMALSYVDARTGKIDKITDAAGGETLFSYDGRGKIQSITDARGRVTQLTVNELGDLVTLAQPGSETHTFVYDAHRMTEKRSPRNDVTTYTFRDDGTLLTATKPEGGTTTLDAPRSHPPAFNAQNKVEYRGGYTDAHGVVHDLVMNLRGQIEKDTYVADGVTRVEGVTYAPELFDYPTRSGASQMSDFLSKRRNVFFLTETRNVNGVVTGMSRAFDAHGRVLREYHGPTSSSSYPANQWWYDADGWIMEEFHGPVYMSAHYQRDAAGHVLRIFDAAPGTAQSPTGRETVWTYRADGLVATRTDHGVTRTFTYDDAGGTKNELGWTDTLGRSMTYTRDAAGNVTSTSDGTATTYALFDARNRVIETRDALNNATTYGYSHAGCGCSLDDLVTSIHTPDLPAGVDWQMTYDGDRRLASVTDPHGFTESYAYEPAGELKKLTDKLLRSTTWTHDQLGRVKTMLDALGRHHGSVYTAPTSGAYAGPSLMAGSNDATASATALTGTLRSGDYQIGHNAYQGFDQPPQISLYRDATFELGFTHYFDTAPTPRTLRRADRTTMAISSATVPSQYAGPLWDEQFGWSASTSMPVLTSLGNDGSQAASFARNAWFDVNEQSGHNNVVGEPWVKDTFTRDAAGRVTQVQRRFFPETTGVAIPPDTFSTYTWRADGRIGRIVNPAGAHDFTYNSRGLVETQSITGEGTYTFGYDEMGRNSYLEFPDGHVRRQVFDDVGRITSRCYEYTGGPQTRCYTAQYDAVGNPVSMLDPEGEDVFEYDGLDRVRKATRKVGGVVTEVEDYEYNALGALKRNAGIVLDHQRPRLDGGGLADAAVPASVAGQPITLDAGGRVTSMRGVTFTWAKKGHVKEVQEPVPALLEKYGVDAELRRTHKIRGTNAEYYFYEGLDRVATLDTTGAVKEAWLFDGIDHPLRIKQGATVAYYELDLAGNVRRLRASGGGDLGGYRYTAFGQTKEDTTTIVQPLRWKGRWHSTLNGAEVYDLRARQWTPEVGAFLSVDEYQYHDSNGTLWAWARQNPLRYLDPTGHDPDEPSTWDLLKLYACYYLGVGCHGPFVPIDHGPYSPPDGGAGPAGGPDAAGGGGSGGGGGMSGGGGVPLGPGGIPGGAGGSCRNDNNRPPRRPDCTKERGLLDMTTGIWSCTYKCADGVFNLKMDAKQGGGGCKDKVLRAVFDRR